MRFSSNKRVKLGVNGSFCDISIKSTKLFGLCLRYSCKRRYTLNKRLEYINIFRKSLLCFTLKSLVNEDKFYSLRLLKLSKIILYKQIKNESLTKHFILGFCIHKSSRKKQFLKAFPTAINHDLILLANSNSGEFFMALFYAIKQLKYEKLLIISNKAYHESIALYLYPKASFIYKKSLMDYVFASKFDLSKTSKALLLFKAGFYLKTSLDAINKHPNFFYLDNILAYLGLHTPVKVCFKPKDSQNEEKNELNLPTPKACLKTTQNEKYIFISPRAASIKDNDAFFSQIISLVAKKNIKVLINIGPKDKPYDYSGFKDICKVVCEDFATSLNLAKNSLAIIGLRSGFMEFISLSNTPMFILYQDVINRDDLSPQMLLYGYSLAKFPQINKNLIKEETESDKLLAEFNLFLRSIDAKKL